jgi:hypothetical protein
MYSFLIIAISAALWMIVSVLNHNVMARFSEANALVDADRILVEHTCRRNPADCPSVFVKDDKLYDDTFTATANPGCTYVKVAYNTHQGYLPGLVAKTRNSYICLGMTSGTAVIPTQPSNKACDDLKAMLPNALAGKTVPKDSVALCQKKS